MIVLFCYSGLSRLNGELTPRTVRRYKNTIFRWYFYSDLFKFSMVCVVLLDKCNNVKQIVEKICFRLCEATSHTNMAVR